MDKRSFLKLGVLGFVSTYFIPRFSFSKSYSYVLPALKYPYNAYEPYIDAQTMEIHHKKHHQTYTDQLNKALEVNALSNESLQTLFSKISTLPVAIRNHGGGYYNHLLFWEQLQPNTLNKLPLPSALFLKKIEHSYGTFENFKKEFFTKAMSSFGSGWTWLIKNSKGNLEIINTQNQDNPLMDVVQNPGVPLLALDVWEHAYYLKYQNRRIEYIDAFFYLINWSVVEARW